MTVSPRDIIRAHCRPRDRLPTDATPILRPLAGLRAVLFDVYGTLLISASGELTKTDSAARAEAICAAFAAGTFASNVPATAAEAALVQTIQEFHDRARAAGIAYPEVEIVEVLEARDEEARSNQQHQRQRDLRHHQPLTQANLSDTAGR